MTKITFESLLAASAAPVDKARASASVAALRIGPDIGIPLLADGHRQADAQRRVVRARVYGARSMRRLRLDAAMTGCARPEAHCCRPRRGAMSCRFGTGLRAMPATAGATTRCAPTQRSA
ncbi:MAG: hypothetical protein NVV68_18685 [Dokdonella sp.]|nr:hypothetical protein [Dokdonella sp.]